MSSDAHHITQPNPAGPAAAMLRAIEDAHATPDDVGYINAHGTGTDANDRVEAEAVHRVFGERARTLADQFDEGTARPCDRRVRRDGTAGDGACPSAANLLPSNAGLADTGVDPALGLDHVLLANEPASPRLGLSSSFAFGGLNAVLAVGRFEA